MRLERGVIGLGAALSRERRSAARDYRTALEGFPQRGCAAVR